MELVWDEVEITSDGDRVWRAKLSTTEYLSVLDRMTGFGCRDIETGFRRWNIDGTTSEFYLATSYDIRYHIKPEHTVADFERMVKEAGNWWTA
jgi:hypothetical protein